ncbi:MAG: iron ABC transporter permease [Chloroflexota bacterium]
MADNILNPTSQILTRPKAKLNLGIQWLPIGIMLVALVAIFLLVLMLGSVQIPISEVVTVLLGGEASRSTWTTIVLQVRLPKAVTAVLAGSALGVSGLMMQTFFRNPLAGPFILGISSGASLGVALVVLTAGTVGGTVLAGLGFFGDLALAGAAGLGAGLTMLIVLLIARQIRSSMTLLILGLMFGYFTSAMVSILLYFAVPERIQSYIRWTFGTFSGTTWSQLWIFVPLVVIGLIGAFILSKTLNALLLGETYARSMGLDVGRSRIAIIGITALLAGTVTAFCGPIGFVGIAVPHLARSLLGTSNHRALVPATILMGAIVALIATIVAEMPGNQIILPLNAVTSLLGAPVVIWVILRRGNVSKTFAS